MEITHGLSQYNKWCSFTSVSEKRADDPILSDELNRLSYNDKVQSERTQREMLSVKEKRRKPVISVVTKIHFMHFTNNTRNENIDRITKCKNKTNI